MRDDRLTDRLAQRSLGGFPFGLGFCASVTGSDEGCGFRAAMLKDCATIGELEKKVRAEEKVEIVWAVFDIQEVFISEIDDL
ncbi:hypothetical protein [Sphingobium yanoikuyae]|uniref:hypothetical protein n=1 Tax=Sphingobium yanoikuyae TaxID=13690 RepID=UPI002FDE4F89